jgi:hypothetical protein
VPFAAFSLVASLVLVGTPAFPASIAGTKCTKVGTTKTTSNIKYTCIKQGSKLVWNKGVAIKPSVKATPAPTPTPAPTATPTETPKQEPKPAATPSPTPTATVAAFVPPKAPTSFDDLVANYKGISYAAWKSAHDKIASSPDTPINFELMMSKNATLNYKTPEVAYSLINKLYYGAPLPTKVIHLVFAFEDRDWAMAKMQEITPNAASQWIKDVACPTKETCYGGGSYYNPITKACLVVIANGIDANNVENVISGTLEAHEYTHLIEQTWPNMDRPPVNLLQSPWPPNWYWEGLAQFSQNASVYTSSFDDYTKFRNRASGGIMNNQAPNAQYIQDYFQRVLTTEWGNKYPRWRQYDLGAMLVEVLVALKGPDLAMKMFDSSLHGGGFDNAFQSIYGISFESVLPNISKAIALELGNA